MLEYYLTITSYPLSKFLEKAESPSHSFGFFLARKMKPGAKKQRNKMQARLSILFLCFFAAGEARDEVVAQRRPNARLNFSPP